MTVVVGRGNADIVGVHVHVAGRIGQFQFVELILLSKNMERIADHATNIAEDVIFMVLGKDIRHHAEEKVK